MGIFKVSRDERSDSTPTYPSFIGINKGLELRQTKEATLQNRKRLAEATREFKRKGCVLFYFVSLCVGV